MVQFNIHFSSSQAIQSQPACAGVITRSLKCYRLNLNRWWTNTWHHSYQDQLTNFATGTKSNINARQAEDSLYGGFLGLYNHLLLVIQDSGPKASAIDSVVPYLNKPRWQDVQTKPTQELFSGKGSWFYLTLIPVVFMYKAHLLVIHFNNTVVADSYPVDILFQVTHHMFHLAQ